MMQNSDGWRKCSTCKKIIGFEQKYYECSVSTCNGQRTGYVFCSIACWDAHVPGAKHRDAAAVEQKSPLTNRVPIEPARRIISQQPNIPKDILIVASKLKDYIRARSEM